MPPLNINSESQNTNTCIPKTNINSSDLISWSPSVELNSKLTTSTSHKDEDKSIDMVNNPPQYQMDDPTYEPRKVISAWKCNFNIGSALKYLARYKKKWNPIEDLEKAKKYIEFELEELKKYK
jgi:hypothetical protein